MCEIVAEPHTDCALLANALTRNSLLMAPRDLPGIGMSKVDQSFVPCTTFLKEAR